VEEIRGRNIGVFDKYFARRIGFLGEIEYVKRHFAIDWPGVTCSALSDGAW